MYSRGILFPYSRPTPSEFRDYGLGFCLEERSGSRVRDAGRRAWGFGCGV